MRKLTLMLVFLVPVSLGQSPVFRDLDGPFSGLDIRVVEATGDFEGDGDADLLTPAGILLNDGNATFAPAPGAVLAGTREGTRVADLDGNGLSDVVSIVFPPAVPTPSLRVDINAGGLSFVPPATPLPPLTSATGANAFPARIEMGDFDADGDVDLVLGTWVFAPLGGLARAAPLLLVNDGLAGFTVAGVGTFAPAGVPGLASYDEHFTDFDGDGDLDLVMGSQLSGPFALHVLTALNLGGSFAAPALLSTAGGDLGLVDANGDGIEDLTVGAGSYGGPSTLTVHFGSASGYFGSVTSQVPIFPGRVLPIDLDGNGRDELLIGFENQEFLLVHPFGASGALLPATQAMAGVRLPELWPAREIVTDLDGDGDADLCGATAAGACLLLSDGNGMLVRLSGRISDGTLPGRLVAGDLDADGDLDVAGFGGTSIVTLVNDGDGWFSVGPYSPVTPQISPIGAVELHAFDRDGDGDMDLYAARNIASAFAQPFPDVVLDNTNGVFSLLAVLGNHGPVSVIRDADIDGDGDRDILLGRRNPSGISGGQAPPLLLVRNLGGGAFAPAVPLGGSHSTYDLEIADFDGNGSLDIFQTNRAPSGFGDSSVLYLNSGPGSFGTMIPVGVSGHFSCAGDLDGNGLPDLVINGQVRFNSGGTGFVAGPTLPSPLGAPALLADVDQDGDLDLVESPAGVMLNLGGGVFGPRISERPPQPLPSGFWDAPSSVVADLDRDLDPDVLGTDGRVHMNALRQVALGAPARPGRPAGLVFHGPPGNQFQLFAAPAPGYLPYLPYGTVLLDLASIVPVLWGSYSTSPSTLGTATLQTVVPNDPLLVGQSLSWQLLDLTQPRISNRIVTTIAGY